MAPRIVRPDSAWMRCYTELPAALARQRGEKGNGFDVFVASGLWLGTGAFPSLSMSRFVVRQHSQ